MKQIKVLTICIGMLLGVQNIFAQGNVDAGTRATNPLPDYVYKNEQKRREMAKIHGKDERGMIRQPPKETSPAQREIILKKQQEAEERKRTILEEINQKFAAPSEYYSKYADFLKEKNTGIARMFPDKDCGKGLTVSVSELERCGNTPPVKGAGSLYSVRLNEMPAYLPIDLILYYVGQSDIHFADGKLIVGNDLTLDIISEIGETDFSNVTSKSEAFKFLTEFKPAQTKSELASQKRTLEKGINSGGYLYSTAAPVKLDSNYILRSVAYSPSPKYTGFWNTDILVAFKIVGQEKDGSIIFIWKKLKQKDAPYLKNK